ncbi:hypothetical protein QAD02_002786 [Eretmocerus hayati]|uniref:Uncharacterized protein n=1 Tax=Eretmocerus hayati TaxID=131215 RepID=A0ACC2NK99_9HYME|nr:hypothetical protein QAD02_002786 [Eretmocerus hayati]
MPTSKYCYTVLFLAEFYGGVASLMGPGSQAVGRPVTPMESASRTTLRRRHDELAVKMKLVKTAQKLIIDEFNVPAVDPLVDPTEPSQESSPLQRTGKVDVPQFSPS